MFSANNKTIKGVSLFGAVLNDTRYFPPKINCGFSKQNDFDRAVLESLEIARHENLQLNTKLRSIFFFRVANS